LGIVVVAVAMLTQAVRLRLRMHRDRRPGVSFLDAEAERAGDTRFGPDPRRLSATVNVLGWGGVLLLFGALIVYMAIT
jgi:hypothetical protein